MSTVETKSVTRESAAHRHPRRAAIVLGFAVAFFGVLSTGLVKCPINALFHFPCPACGTNRAAHALLDRDFHEALRTNPIAPIAIALLVALFLRIAFLEYRDGTMARLGEGRVGEFVVRWLVRCAWLSIALWIMRALGFFGGLPDQ